MTSLASTNNINKLFEELNKNLNLQTTTENGEDAVTAGPKGGFVSKQSSLGQVVESQITEMFSQSVRDKNIDEWIEEICVLLSHNFCDLEENINYHSLIYRFLANLRDCREGKGERKLSYVMFYYLYQSNKELAKKFLELFGKEYGSYADLVKIYCQLPTIIPNRILKLDDIRNDILEIFTNILLNEVVVNGNEVLVINNPSFAGKWAPRENKTITKLSTKLSKRQARMARKLAWTMYLKVVPESNWKSLYENDGTIKKKSEIYARTIYRKIISAINVKLKVVETIMSDNRFADIVPNHVPSGAMSKYGKLAFQNKNKDGSIRSEKVDRIKSAENFKNAFEETRKTGKGIKGKMSGAHKIAKGYISSTLRKEDESIEAMWSNLVHETKESLKVGNGLPSCVALCDVSGSMQGVPLEVCVALGILLSSIAPGMWKDNIITFSENPEFHHIVGNSLFEKVQNLKRAKWGCSTNFEKALNLILTTAVKNKLTEEDMPKMLVIFSDMQFNEAEGVEYYGSGRNCDLKHSANNIKNGFEKAGYEMPHVVFWNLRAVNALPCESLTEGVSIMSGYSENMLKAFMTNTFQELEQETPWDIVSQVLSSERYNIVDELVRNFFN